MRLLISETEQGIEKKGMSQDEMRRGKFRFASARIALYRIVQPELLVLRMRATMRLFAATRQQAKTGTNNFTALQRTAEGRCHVDVPVETEDFAENENQHHADKDAALLHESAHALVADDADGVAGGQAGEADGETGSQVHEAAVVVHVSGGCLDCMLIHGLDAPCAQRAKVAWGDTNLNKL